MARLAEDKDNKKAREGFLESARTLELLDQKELETLAETMFKGTWKQHLSSVALIRCQHREKELKQTFRKTSNPTGQIQWMEATEQPTLSWVVSLIDSFDQTIGVNHRRKIF